MDFLPVPDENRKPPPRRRALLFEAGASERKALSHTSLYNQDDW